MYIFCFEICKNNKNQIQKKKFYHYNFFRSGVKSLYGLSRSVMWILASSSVILFAPVIFEVERAQVEEMQKSQQKQVR